MALPRPMSGDTQPGDPAPALRFERRQIDRWPISGVATAFHLSGDEFGRMHTLRLIDCSHDGLGAQCSTPLTAGAVVSIGFQNPGCTAKRGVVTRCLPCGDGYRIGIQFESRLAA